MTGHSWPWKKMECWICLRPMKVDAVMFGTAITVKHLVNPQTRCSGNTLFCTYNHWRLVSAVLNELNQFIKRFSSSHEVQAANDLFLM